MKLLQCKHTHTDLNIYIINMHLIHINEKIKSNFHSNFIKISIWSSLIVQWLYDTDPEWDKVNHSIILWWEKDEAPDCNTYISSIHCSADLLYTSLLLLMLFEYCSEIHKTKTKIVRFHHWWNKMWTKFQLKVILIDFAYIVNKAVSPVEFQCVYCIRLEIIDWR